MESNANIIILHVCVVFYTHVCSMYLV